MPPMGPPGRNNRQPKAKQKPKNTKATIKRLMSYLNTERYRITGAIFCVLLSSAATLCGSYLLRPIINGLTDTSKTAQQKVAELLAGLLLMGAVYFVGVLATYFQARIMIGVSQRTLNKIREQLFKSLQKLPVRYFDQNPTGDIMKIGRAHV